MNRDIFLKSLQSIPFRVSFVVVVIVVVFFLSFFCFLHILCLLASPVLLQFAKVSYRKQVVELLLETNSSGLFIISCKFRVLKQIQNKYSLEIFQLLLEVITL